MGLAAWLSRHSFRFCIKHEVQRRRLEMSVLVWLGVAAVIAVVVKTNKKRACQCWFGIWFFITNMCIWVLALCLHNLPGIPTFERFNGTAKVCRYFYRLVFTMCPWIKLNDRSIPWHEMIADVSKTGRKGGLLISNHVGPLDSFTFVSICPPGLIGQYRTFLKAQLLSLPILGGILKMTGHFPVHFKSSEENNFSTDKEKMAAVSADTTAYLEAGGGLVLFPEGQVNKNPSELQPFRHGSFDYAVKYKLPVWAIVSTNIEKAWPPKAGMGGFPAKIDFRLFKVELPPNADKEVMSTLAREQMQAVLNDMLRKADSSSPSLTDGVNGKIDSNAPMNSIGTVDKKQN